jgi:hypothetical protein
VIAAEVVLLGVVGAALGVRAGMDDGNWATVVIGCLLAVGSLPMLWGGFEADRAPTPNVVLALWHFAMVVLVVGAVFVLLAADSTTARVGMALVTLGALGYAASFDVVEASAAASWFG